MPDAAQAGLVSRWQQDRQGMGRLLR